MSKVEQWLEHPDFLNVGDPDAGLLPTLLCCFMLP